MSYFRRSLLLATLAASPLVAQTSDPRVGLRAGLNDAGQAIRNMRLVSTTPPSDSFHSTNSDLAFLRNYVIQGNYNGYQVWDISNPAQPRLRKGFYCPASQSDVSVYRNLLFVSAEGTSSRLDCTAKGVQDTVSHERLLGIRIFDITNIDNPRYITSVQTCRGSHTHSLLVDPKDKDNVYVYVSGSAGIRSPSELAGCIGEPVDKNPNSALMRIEVIKVPLANPEKAAVVNAPRIFQGLTSPKTHGVAYADSVAAVHSFDSTYALAAGKLAAARANNGFIARLPIVRPFTTDTMMEERSINPLFVRPILDSIVKARGGTGDPTAADSATLRGALQGIIDTFYKNQNVPQAPSADPIVFRQCHDITLYPAIGRAGGACEGHGLLLDISNPAAPVRLDAAEDQNFSYWHSATFNNDGTKILFSDEWGGGGAPKCRSTDPKEWGADAIFTIGADNKLKFQSYYKLPAPQTPLENCVAHNGSLIPIPGRDVMVQSWYQGGISIFDWTDAAHPFEIGFFDRGPIDSTRFSMGGSWSVYWYNGNIVSSEIARGLDILELTPSQYISQNEIDAAKTVKLDYLNTQGQPKFTWPASFALSRAYVDQLERSKGLSSARITAIRNGLADAEKATAASRPAALTRLATSVDADVAGSSDATRVKALASSIRQLAK